jgi:hypothetical protein
VPIEQRLAASGQAHEYMADFVARKRKRPDDDDLIGLGTLLHHCLGAPLARMEMRIAFPALLRRFPGLRSVLPADQVPYRTHAIYGLDALPVAW